MTVWSRLSIPVSCFVSGAAWRSSRSKDLAKLAWQRWSEPFIGRSRITLRGCEEIQSGPRWWSLRGEMEERGGRLRHLPNDGNPDVGTAAKNRQSAGPLARECRQREPHHDDCDPPQKDCAQHANPIRNMKAEILTPRHH